LPCLQASCVFRADMTRILFVALTFEGPLHFLQIGAGRWSRRTERPRAGGATPSLDPVGLDPHHASQQNSPGTCACITPKGSSLLNECHRVLPGTNRKRRRRRRRLVPQRLEIPFPCKWVPFAIAPVRLGCRRRAPLATRTGTCSKCVFVLCAAAIYTPTPAVTAFQSYGENL
jgi:hypothetical protein